MLRVARFTDLTKRIEAQFGTKQKRSGGKQPERKSRPFKGMATIGHDVACQLNFIMIIESASVVADLQNAASGSSRGLRTGPLPLSSRN